MERAAIREGVFANLYVRSSGKEGGRGRRGWLDGRAVGNLLDHAVPLRILVAAKVGAVEKLLQADDLRPPAGRLLDQADVLVDHRLFDLLNRRGAGLRKSGLNESASNDTWHD